MTQRLDQELVQGVVARLERRAMRPWGATGAVPPLHTLRIAADHFRHDSVPRAGARALRLLQTFAPDSVVLALALRLPGCEALPTDPARVDALLGRLEAGDPGVHPSAALAHEVYRRVHRQLSRSPVQDVRIDFHRLALSDAQKDLLVATAATEVALGLREGLLDVRLGVRIEPLEDAMAERAIATLDGFLSGLVDRAGQLPDRFVVSVPDVTRSEQASGAAQLVNALEARLGLARGHVGLEIGISDPQAVFDESGSCQIGAIAAACQGRCVGVRVEADAFARSLGVRDPSGADVARDVLRLALAGRGVAVSSGASPPLPPSGRRDSPERYTAVHAAWRSHAEAVGRSLRAGTTWGWDHDAAQIPARLAAVTAWFRSNLPTLRAELADGSSARPFDEAVIGLDCGALSPEDLAGTGIELADLAQRSFFPANRP